MEREPDRQILKAFKKKLKETIKLNIKRNEGVKWGGMMRKEIKTRKTENVECR